MRDKEITTNEKLAAMRADHAASAHGLQRGDLVRVMPTRGLAVRGLLCDIFEHPWYGRFYDVLYDGKVNRVDAERISAWRG